MSAEPGPRSQILFRRLNEEIRSLAADDELVVVCECVNDECVERLVVPIELYEAVRRFPKEGHVAADVDRAVESRDGVVVVEKTGEGAEDAIVLDPRRPTARRPRVVETDADLPLTREVCT
jgi:hypothetical protein